MAVDNVKRLHVIACGVLAIDLKDVARRIGIDISMEFLPGGLHSTPRELRKRLQEAIDHASSEHKGDMIAVGYGVCGMGAVGIHARGVPLAIPKVNDCIALFLGSDAAYREQFTKYPGTYYLSAGWVAEKATPISDCPRDTHGAGEPDACDSGGQNARGKRGPGACGTAACGDRTVSFDELVAAHGQENADAIRYFLDSWQRNYQRAAFIDTGVPGRHEAYARLAQDMAHRFGWKYERLCGSAALLEKLLRQRITSDEVLVVPPHHVTAYDAVAKTLMAVPVWRDGQGKGAGRSDGEQIMVFDDAAHDNAATGAPIRTGLGIDAGGTYTDVVLYDFADSRVLQKAKALTTKWDFTVGIEQSLDQLDQSLLRQVELAAVSTTLATNAIVEGRGQKVGLLLMPPYGKFYPEDIPHQPVAVLDGKMEIDGKEIAPIDPGQVRTVVAQMLDRHRVGALAVVGYASHINPAHELAVARIIRDEFGVTVTCGQDVSEGANYAIRANTAVLNARIIPQLEALLEQVSSSMQRRGIAAPVMVVKSDGALMNISTARQRPIETILSGPAASVAGASFLAKVSDAVVVDIGGTTTDTAGIADGTVRTCADGALVGPWRTHVRALDIRTMGLGGDSLIRYEKQTLRIGPRRVAPVAWLAAQGPGLDVALNYLERRLDQFTASTGGMELLWANPSAAAVPLNDQETAILEELQERPMSLQELAKRLEYVAWEFLPLERLEENHLIQRCFLTPTDLLHITGAFRRWDQGPSRRLAGMMAMLAGMDVDPFIQRVFDQMTRQLAIELVKKQLDAQGSPTDLEDSPAAMALIDNMLAGGDDRYRVSIKLRRPIIGIGAPASFFLQPAAGALDAELLLPADGDVANAIGAITSTVRVHKSVTVAPNESGGYSIEGLTDTPRMGNFEAASDTAVSELVKLVRLAAAEQGTSSRRVEIVIRDHVATVADGSELLIGRTLEGRLYGQPDVARLRQQ